MAGAVSVKSLNDFIGTPYAALDCYALLREASVSLYGVHLPPLLYDPKRPHEAIDEQEITGRWLRLAGPEPGCVVSMGHGPRVARHVGLQTPHGVLHTCQKYGALVQDEVELLASGYTHLRYFKWA